MSNIGQRTGFSKTPSIKEWQVKDGTVIWKNNPNTSIKFSSLPFLRPDPVLPPDADEKSWFDSFKRKISRKHKMTVTERLELMREAYMFSPTSYLKILRKILNSTDWNDTEKLYLLMYKLPYLCGNRNGKEIETSLSKIKWKKKIFKDRMSDFYNAVRKYGFERNDYLRGSGIDEKEVQSFPQKVTLYRGFLVPISESIRDVKTERWLKQATGKSVYFSIDKDVATYFAAINKYNAIGMTLGLDELEIKQQERIKLEAKLAVARYEVDINDIILYDDYLGRKESECVCLPEKVDLINYEFLGFNDFVSALQSRHPSKHKI